MRHRRCPADRAQHQRQRLWVCHLLCWLAAALLMRDRALALLNVGFTVINLIGIVRWLG